LHLPPLYAILIDQQGVDMEKGITNPMPPQSNFELGKVKIGGDAIKVEEPPKEESKKDEEKKA